MVVLARWTSRRHSIFLIALVALSTTYYCQAMATSSSVGSCVVVGVGVLGTSLCKQLLEHDRFQDTILTGITKSTNRHDAIRQSVGDVLSSRLLLKTKDQIKDDETFDNVVFCAPPSGFEDYAEAVKDAAQKLWNKQGTFVFTSSGGVYDPSSGETVLETSPTGDPNSPRVGRLLAAEKAVTEAGGCALRLGGLYDLQRGAHNYWFTSVTEVASGPDGIVNLLHYDDAAGACLAALLVDKSAVKGRVFLISDGNPTTRRGICESALKAAVYKDNTMPKFAPSDSKKGKVYDGSWSNQQLKWKPRYESFDQYMQSNA